MANITVDIPSGGYKLENSLISVVVKPNTVLSKLTVKSLSRDVAYGYMYFDYYTENDIYGSQYLNSLSGWALTPSPSGSAVNVQLEKTFEDSNAITHAITLTVSLTDGANNIEVDWDVVSSQGLKKHRLALEANLYPQGYALQNAGGNFNVGGNTTYTVPAQYNDLTYSFKSSGIIDEGNVELTTVNVIDNYIACYGTDASAGVYGKYVDMSRLRTYCLSAGGDERQWIWLDIIPYPITKTHFKSNFKFGGWAVGNATGVQAAYTALPKVQNLTTQPAARYNYIVRTDLNAELYDYHQKFDELLTKFDGVNPVVNATVIPAGTASFRFYKYHGDTSIWNGTVADLGEDYVYKSITMCGPVDKRLFVEVDVLDGTWNTANPNDRAIGVDCITPAQSWDGNYYWVKLAKLITPGEAYHDAFIDHVTYLCENYNFYGLVLSECFYRHVDYSAETKALFLADNPSLTDWPRNSDGTVDTYDETLGKWKTTVLGTFWSEITAIANANNKKFFVMVEPNFNSASRQAWEYGHYYPEAIQHVDGLWIWAYYGNFGVSHTKMKNIIDKINVLESLYPTKENIISIGMWGPDDIGGIITPQQLEDGISYINTTTWRDTQGGIEITPSKHMTSEHWAVLWGEASIVITSPNPLCSILETSLSTGISKLRKAISMQNAIKKQTDHLIAMTDLTTVINEIPDFDLSLNTDIINAMKNSCPGQFPDLPAINSTIADSLKDYLNDLKGSPLGQLSSLVDSLNSYMSPISALNNTLFNYLVCLKNICNLTQAEFDTQWQSLTNLKTALNLDSNGKPQILDSTTKSVMDLYGLKVYDMKQQMKAFKL